MGSARMVFVLATRPGRVLPVLLPNAQTSVQEMVPVIQAPGPASVFRAGLDLIARKALVISSVVIMEHVWEHNAIATLVIREQLVCQHVLQTALKQGCVQ